MTDPQPQQKKRPTFFFGFDMAIVALAIMLSVGYLFISPPLSPPDEGAHLAYPRFILVEHQLPTYAHASDAWENHQPPLYYVASLPFVWLGSRLPFMSQVFVNRLISVVFLFLGLWLTWLTARRLWPNDGRARAAALSIFLLPMVLYAGGSFNNDISTLFIASWLLWSVYAGPKSITNRQALVVGLIGGLGLLTKVDAYPLLAVFLLWRLWRQPLSRWLVTGGMMVLVSGWWFIQNALRVGDLLGLKYTKIFWPYQHIPINSWHILGQLIGKLAASFVGVFDKLIIRIPTVWYGAILLVLAAILISGLRLMRRNKQVAWLIAAVVVTVLGVIYENSVFFQPQGRYLIVLVPAFALLAGMVTHAYQTKRLPWVPVAAWVTILLAVNVVSLTTLHRYYQLHPETWLQNPRTVDLTAAMLSDNAPHIHQQNGIYLVSTPAKFAVTGDLMETNHHPVLSIEAGGPAFDLTIEWRIPGQRWFDSRRTQTVHVDETAVVTFPEKTPTALEGIRLTFPASTTPIVLRQIVLAVE